MTERYGAGVAMLAVGFVLVAVAVGSACKTLKAHSPKTSRADNRLPRPVRLWLTACAVVMHVGMYLVAFAANELGTTAAPWELWQVTAINVAFVPVYVSLVVGIRRHEAVPILKDRFTWHDARDLAVFVGGLGLAALPML